MRISTAALALIRRTTPDGVPQWLTLWNENWRALSLVGGHRHADESFRDCCVREVTEELELVPDLDFRVAPAPEDHLEYVAESGSAGVPTAYTMELFPVELLTDTARKRVEADPDCCWLTEGEIRAQRSHDGRAVSATVERLLTAANEWGPARTDGPGETRRPPR